MIAVHQDFSCSLQDGEPTAASASGQQSSEAALGKVGPKALQTQHRDYFKGSQRENPYLDESIPQGDSQVQHLQRLHLTPAPPVKATKGKSYRHTALSEFA